MPPAQVALEAAVVRDLIADGGHAGRKQEPHCHKLPSIEVKICYNIPGPIMTTSPSHLLQVLSATKAHFPLLASPTTRSNLRSNHRV